MRRKSYILAQKKPLFPCLPFPMTKISMAIVALLVHFGGGNTTLEAQGTPSLPPTSRRPSYLNGRHRHSSRIEEWPEENV